MHFIRNLATWFKKAAKALALLGALIAAVSTGAAVWGTYQTTVDRPAAPSIVNDVTQINPIVVAQIIVPTTADEIVTAVRTHKGPISIGGGRYSMGGQTATEQALHIDMRKFNKTLAFSKEDKTITVQAGARWRQIQEHIDPHDLSIMIMQTYSNFTVGGSLSVNVHGRYVGHGPLIHSVKSLRVILPDGNLVDTSPDKRREIFFGVIGGYGGLGIITEATLQLADNVGVERRSEKMPITRYKGYFFENIRDLKSAVFHNADIYPDEYDTVRATSYFKTDKAVTVTERLVPQNLPYRLDRFVYWVISDWPFGKDIREHIVDPILFSGPSIRWRNYEASYDVAELEPSSREDSTYVLQEYFVPVARFDEFVPKMRSVLRSNEVNVINVSIRHAHKDPGALLAWARDEVFAFVLYYKQGTDFGSKKKVGKWTRELVDAVLSVGGSYYLPYQLHATEEQFLKAYPRSPEFFALKKRLDPENRFRNRLWDKYYAAPTAKPITPEQREKLRGRTGYLRDGGQTYLTHPEWYIVYSYDEFASYLEKGLPSGFPYVSAIGQYWTNYLEVNRLTRGTYDANWGYQLMLWVIGTSYTIEYTLKGLYENSIGRLSEWLAGNSLVDEDRYAYRVAKEYAEFTHVRPWYEYKFSKKLCALWTDIPLWGAGVLRKWERKLILSVEYGLKSIYASVIEAGTGAVYDPEDDRMQMVVASPGGSILVKDSRFKIVEQLDSAHVLATTPRYDVFRNVMFSIANSGVQLEILEIAGNTDILVTGVAPRQWQYSGRWGVPLYALPVPSDDSRKRVAMRVPTKDLIELLREAQAGNGLVIDHIYDY